MWLLVNLELHMQLELYLYLAVYVQAGKHSIGFLEEKQKVISTPFFTTLSAFRQLWQRLYWKDK